MGFGPAQGGGGAGPTTSGLSTVLANGADANFVAITGLNSLTAKANSDLTVQSNGSGSLFLNSATEPLCLEVGGSIYARVRATKFALAVPETWETGLGAITHILGPTDQNLKILAPSSRSLSLGAGGVLAMQIAAGGSTSLFSTDGNTCLSVDGSTATQNCPPLDVRQTWNAGGVTFRGIELAVTDTASDASSTLMRLFGGVAGSTIKFSITGAGATTITPTAGTAALSLVGGTVTGSSAAPLSITQTWNNAATTFRGVDWTFTGTTQAAASTVFRILGGSAGTTSLFSVLNQSATVPTSVGIGTASPDILASGNLYTQLTIQGPGTSASYPTINFINPQSITADTGYHAVVLRVFGTSSPTTLGYIVAQPDTTGASTNNADSLAWAIATKTTGNSAVSFMGIGKFDTVAGNDAVSLVSGASFAWTDNATDGRPHAGGAGRPVIDTQVNRDSAGVVGFGTTAKNTSGSWKATNGTLASAGTLMFSTDAALSRGGAASTLAIGNGTAGNGSGKLTVTTVQAPSTDNLALTASGGGDVDITAGSGGWSVIDGGNLNGSGQINLYKNVSTEGTGVAPIYKATQITAQSTNATITSLSVPAAGDYEVSGTLNVSAAVAVSTAIEVTYTDTASGAQTLVLPLQKAGGTAGTYLATGLAVTTGDFTTPVQTIRVAAGSTITIRTQAGTFTTVTYSASAAIKRIR